MVKKVILEYSSGYYLEINSALMADIPTLRVKGKRPL